MYIYVYVSLMYLVCYVQQQQQQQTTTSASEAEAEAFAFSSSLKQKQIEIISSSSYIAASSLMRRFPFSFSFSFFTASLFSPKYSHNLNLTHTKNNSYFFPSSSSSSSSSPPLFSLNPSRYWAHQETSSMAPTTANSPTTTTATATTTGCNNILHHHSQSRRQKKIVVIMGPTGSGKSKLSIDLATRFFPSSEIINSDKIQVYKGLDITTNKISMPDRKGVPHHLLGEFQPTDSTPEFTPSAFRTRAADVASQIISRRKIPFVVGGSNSFIYSLLAKRYDPELDVFDESHSVDSVCKLLRYDCCFIWVDVHLPVLNEYLDMRVDEMLDSGMFEELAEFFASESPDSLNDSGVRRAIGVPEFEKYFKHYHNKKGRGDDVEEYERAVRLIKENTWQLAKRQLGKIQRLREAGWDLHKIDATQAFRAVLDKKKSRKQSGGGGEEVTSDAGGDTSAAWDPSFIWEKQVVEPSVKIVKQFLME